MMENRAVTIQQVDTIYHMIEPKSFSSHYTDMFDPCVITDH